MRERIPFVDWLRAVACFMVMLVHAAENFYGVVTEKAIESIPGGAEKLAGFERGEPILGCLLRWWSGPYVCASVYGGVCLPAGAHEAGR